jgi:hypothetical protein
MHPEEGFFLEGMEVVIELQVVFLGEVAGGFFPGSLLFINLLSFELDGKGEEIAVGFD